MDASYYREAMSSTNPHVTIAGGAGFIGSHLCDHFIQKGFRVTCIDNLITGSEENIRHLYSDNRFSFLKQDVTVPFDVSDSFGFVLNLASPASPIDYQKYPIETLRVGAWGTWNLLELARKKKAKFLLASTSEVYGDPKIHPQREDYWGNVNPVGPRSCYDEAKRYAESLTIFYHQKFGLPISIARIFNTYGPRMGLNDGRALPTFLRQALQGEPLTVFGDGSQTRSFCYVEDMVNGLEKLLFSNEPGPINLGNPEEMTLLEFAKQILKWTKSESKITFSLLPQDDPKTRKPDISKARQLLRWEPVVDLETGLKKTIKEFQGHYKERSPGDCS